MAFEGLANQRFFAMQRTLLLTVTAFVETLTGLTLLIVPSILLKLLFEVRQASPETNLIARIAGAALLAFGIAVWFARRDSPNRAQFGTIVSALVYNVAVSILLGYAGLFLGMTGIALWPAVILHCGLAGWCAVCIAV